MTDLLPYLGFALLLLILFRVERIGKQISQLSEQIDGLNRELGAAPPLSPEPSKLVRQLALDSSKKIEAIKAYRRESGADLRKAKQVVEQLRGDA